MHYQEKINKFEEALLKADSVLIVTHRDPDFDAIASSLALSLQLKKKGVSSFVWMKDIDYDRFSFLPHFSLIKRDIPNNFVFDTLVCLDSSNLERVPDIEQVKYSRDKITLINIDHHIDNTRFGDINLLGELSSVGELLFWVFDEINWEVGVDVACCLYTAICDDTGRFMFSNVSSSTHFAAAKLLKTGIDANNITSMMYENKSLATFELMKVAIDRLVVCDELSYAYTSITKENDMGNFKVVDFIRQLKDVSVFLVFQERANNEVKINLRAKESFNVSSFAAIFGGGGHKKASGIAMKGKLDSVVTKIISKLENEIKKI